MAHFTVDEMLIMQRRLQEKYRDQWEPISPETARQKLLWMVSEVGEVIDIVKKQGDEQIMRDAAVRAHFVEEMADVLMYFGDVMLCYGITEQELKQIHEAKFERNMSRW